MWLADEWSEYIGFTLLGHHIPKGTQRILIFPFRLSADAFLPYFSHQNILHSIRRMQSVIIINDGHMFIAGKLGNNGCSLQQNGPRVFWALWAHHLCKMSLVAHSTHRTTDTFPSSNPKCMCSSRQSTKARLQHTSRLRLQLFALLGVVLIAFWLHWM